MQEAPVRQKNHPLQSAYAMVNSFKTLKEALAKRMDFFASMGCSVSDHALEYVMYVPASENVGLFDEGAYAQGRVCQLFVAEVPYFLRRIFVQYAVVTEIALKLQMAPVEVKNFMDKDFLLDSPTAQTLYHEYAAKTPVLDYHCHINPQEIAQDRQFDSVFTSCWQRLSKRLSTEVSSGSQHMVSSDFICTTPSPTAA